MSKLKILLLESIHPVADGLLEAEGFEVNRADGALKEDELVARLKGVHLLGIRSKTQVTQRVLDAADSLVGSAPSASAPTRSSSTPPTSAASPVFNAPFSNTRSVAELMIAEIVMLSRQLGDRVARGARRASGSKVATGSREVRGKTLGIVGYGHIGTPGRRARRGAGHARRLLRHARQAADGQQRSR